MSVISRLAIAAFMFLSAIVTSIPLRGAEVTLRAGDVLSIDLPGEVAFDTPFQVGREGKIDVPEVGTVHVADKSVVEVQTLIRVALARVIRDAEGVTVRLIERRLSVTVLGFVGKPGPVDLPDNATVQMALSAAGGISVGAQLDRLQIRRGNNVTAFNYKHYLDSGDLHTLPVLRPLDVLFVPASPLMGNVQVDFDASTLTQSGDGADDISAIKVFGEVHRPGLFAHKADATLLDMLMRAGGVTRYAGVEQIRVISHGEPAPFNMREYLDTGNPDLMPSIAAGDTIFVPQATEQIKKGARTVYVMGNVFKPGAFETKDGATFFDILANAGGPTRFADTRTIRILRAGGSVEPFDLDAYTEGTVDVAMPNIFPGDAILVSEKTDMNEKSWLKVAPSRAIRIIGAIVRPGRYEWSDEMSLMDLIAHAGGPIPSADSANLQVLSESPNGATQPTVFDLESYLHKGGNVANLPKLAAGDTIFVPELPKDPSDNRSQWIRLTKERAIYVFGEVGVPGRFAFSENLTFLDILSAANGPTSQADLHNVKITHRGEAGARTTHLDLALYFQTGDESLLPQVKPEDVIYIPERNREYIDIKKEETVRVLGSVTRPGRYAFNDTMTILDLLAQAGGPTANAYEERIVVVNRLQENAQAQSFDLISFAKSGDFEMLPVIRAGDTVYVPNEEESPVFAFRSFLKDAISLITIASLAFGG